MGAVVVGGYARITAGLFFALAFYGLAFVAVVVIAAIVNSLAPTFGGDKDFGNALRLSAYSQTPAWLAGIFLLVPGLSFFGILGLYGFALLWIGLPVLMRAPASQALAYAAAVGVVTLIIVVGAGGIALAVTGLPR